MSTKTKHLRLAFHAVLERVTDNEIVLQHVSGVDNPADLFTKPLPKSDLRSMFQPFSMTASSLIWSGSRASMTDLSALRTL